MRKDEYYMCQIQADYGQLFVASAQKRIIVENINGGKYACQTWFIRKGNAASVT